MNVADVAPGGTLTEAGTGSAAGMLDASVTALPPVGAAWFKVAVQVVEAPDVTLVGLQTSEDTPRAGVMVTVAMVLPPSGAVTVTVSEAATEPAVAVKVAVVVVAGTVSEAGTGNAVVLFDASVTVLPPAGAA